MIVIFLSVISLSLVFVVLNNAIANKVAHELARLVRFPPTKDWLEEPLSEIVPFLRDDATVISI